MPARFAGASQRGTLAGPWPEGAPTAHHDMTMLNGGHLPFTYRIPYSVWQREHQSNDLPSVVPQIVTGLAEAANTYQAGFLRDELLRIAGQAMQKAAGHHRP